MNNDDKKDQPENSDQLQKLDSTYFGSIKPLTAAQVVSLIIPSGNIGASACY